MKAAQSESSLLEFIGILVVMLAGGVMVAVMSSGLLDDLSAHYTPDAAETFTGEGEVLTVEYEPPQRGVFSSRPGYWEAKVVLNGEVYSLTYPDEPDLKVGQKVMLQVVPCENPASFCGVSVMGETAGAN